MTNSQNQNNLPNKKSVLDNLIVDTSGKTKGELGKGYMVDSVRGDVKVSTQDEVLEEMRKNPNLSKDSKEALEKTEQDEGTKAKYREGIYKIQDAITKKAMAKELELRAEKDPKKRELILFEIKEMGRFCSALEKELQFIRNR